MPWITQLTVESVNARPKLVETGTHKSISRWGTREFKFYYVVFAICLPIMFWVPMRLSQDTHPNFGLYRHKLSHSWMGQRDIDVSDAQYRQIRRGLPMLAVLAFVHLVAYKAYRRIRGGESQTTRLSFSVPASVAMLVLLHGASTIKILAILYLVYVVAKARPGHRSTPIFVWSLNLGILFLNELCNGYPFGALSTSLSFLDQKPFNGLIPRWQIGFNISILRLISFSMDYHWSITLTTTPTTPHMLHSESDYTFFAYLAYVLYPPLYIAGPIMSFNSYMTQLKSPTKIASMAILKYAIRFIVCLAAMEWILHHMYVVAIKDAKAWTGDSPLEITMIGFWNLIIIWLKLLIPWRFFRLWALADGMDPPENMIRCMANNYSVLGFWRSWHRSYNLWIIRYIYIPLGGSKNAILATTVVFTFVALWHDLSLRLLAWGWAVSIFVLPEMTCRKLVPASKFASEPWYRPAAALGGVANILMLMTANLIGFAIGVDGTKHLAQQLTSTISGIMSLVLMCGALFVGVQIMFEYREEEMRQGIDRKC